MKMIDILKQELKEGMTIKDYKELSNKYKVSLSYNGMEASTELSKTCMPGCEKEVCRNAIDDAVSTMYVNAGDLVEARKWLYGECWDECDNNGYKRVNNDTWICNQIEELVDELFKNKEDIGKRVISETEDYYSFLHGFDYVLEKVKYILYNQGE